MTVSRTLVIAALMLTMSSQAALAQAPGQWVLNPNAPVEIHGGDEQTGFDSKTCSWLLKGDVEVTQDRIRLRAKTLTTFHARRGGDCGSINRIEAERDVYYVTPTEAVRADRAVYDMATDMVTFTGGVIITRGQNVATSERLTINLKTNDVQFKGGVRAVFYPNRTAQ